MGAYEVVLPDVYLPEVDSLTVTYVRELGLVRFVTRELDGNGCIILTPSQVRTLLASAELWLEEERQICDALEGEAW